MRNLKHILIRGALTGAVASLVLFGLGWCFLTGLDKEAIRQDTVRQYNCEHYGAAINKHYGREVCPERGQL